LEQARRENAFRFVNQVVLDLRRDGAHEVGILEKSGGANAFGYSADNLTVKQPDGSVLHFDIVGSSEAEDAVVAWSENGPIDPARFRDPDPRFALDPQEPPGPPPPPPPPPLPPPPDDVATIILQVLRDILVQQDQIAQQVESVRLGLTAAAPTLQLVNERVAAINAKLDSISGSKGFVGVAKIRLLGDAPIDLNPKP
jgi:hypothetical protein